MSEDPKPVTKVWLPKFEVENFMKSAEQQADRAELLLLDSLREQLTLSKELKVLLRELYCLAYKNLSYFEEIFEGASLSKDGVEGYALHQEVVLSLSTFAVNLKQITSELFSLNIVLEDQ